MGRRAWKKESFEVNSVKFTGEVLKKVKMATYEINMKRILKKQGAVVGLANGILLRMEKKFIQQKI